MRGAEWSRGGFWCRRTVRHDRAAHATAISHWRTPAYSYRATYADGKLAAPTPGASDQPQACAGVKGTQIAVSDLFFNMPQRSRALQSAAEVCASLADRQAAA